MARFFKTALTAERAREVFHYDAETGELLWKVQVARHVKAGAVAGWLSDKGYRVVGVDGVHYLVHRVIWLILTGEWPEGEIDHGDRTRSNNRPGNIRPATRSQNRANTPPRANTVLGIKGVTPSGRKFKAQIGAAKKGNYKYLGTHDTAQEAHEAYMIEAVVRYGEYARAA